MSLRYRPEIDGLRTIAVCSVLIYHAKLSVGGVGLLPGGYLGVDIFFVISGFLITSLILQEWDRTGRFSILNFYERRARRLLPALFAVILASLGAAWFILLPTQMEEFVKSILASIFFVSNMFWYAVSLEYGAEPGLIKPFLHTWSLAVEEQFYIFFPLLYLAVLRWLPRLALVLAGLGVLGGLLVAEYATRVNSDLSFYWVISRLWELLAGGFLAHLHIRHPQASTRLAALRVLPGIGLVLLAVPLTLPDLIETHPGFVTVPTVLGTVLVIGFARPDEPVTRLLSLRPFVAIGLISYSLYLWHYPIYAFGRMIDPAPEVSDRIVWMVLSFALAALCYRLVEQPFRRPGMVGLRGLARAGFASTAVVAVYAAAMLGTGGYPDRLARLYAIYAPAEPDNARISELDGGTWTELIDRAKSLGVQGPHVRLPRRFDSQLLWYDIDRDDEKILILGNSLSIDLYNAFVQNAPLFPDRQFARMAMRADFPDRHIDILLNSPNFQAADTILIAHAYTERSVRRLDPLLDRLIPSGKRIVVLLHSPIFRQIEGYWPFDWYVRTQGGLPSQEALERLAYENLDRAQTEPLDRALEEIARRRGVDVLRRKDYICDDAAQTCNIVTDDGHKMFTDQHHYTRKGAAEFGRRIHELGWLDRAYADRPS